ncbi:MAG: tRNA (adenosine(37)-N6)-threonylcarbamoyltransferase complex dimerization subunit type 1 TsaB [Desulfobacterales bacterium]|nr:tRNA (adenosine(37)-N6)-threonylcarbamoyltransferase complex dimerization subunit type 1 TsaB [Desulfobacterales bacterium]
MKLFALSTAENGASMALFDGDEKVCSSYWASRQTHSRRLMSMVEQMIQVQAGLTVDVIDGFIAAKGPGSFTGLRIGISVIKGLAYSFSKPCAGISSLDGIAFGVGYSPDPVCVMMDAKRNEVYTALYRFEQGRLVHKGEESVCSPKHAVTKAGASALFVGSGSKAYREVILELTGGQARFSPPSVDSVSASAMIRIALASPALFESAENRLEPVYLRKSDAEIHFAGTIEKAKKGAS